ncbi:MAG TPA: hypothetical protein VGM35_04085 [Xanthobacteraceae bacterium]|jgi:hypothetical protein
MTRFSLAVLCAALTLPVLTVGPSAVAQLLGPNVAPSNPPPPPPPPPPRMDVPVVPQMDAPPRANLKAPPRKSFGHRVTKCLEDGAAAGLDPADRAAYSRACANQ